MRSKQKDLKPKWAASVKKLCQWHNFNEAGVRRVLKAKLSVAEQCRLQSNMRPSAPATYGITFVYQAKVILFLCANRITTRFFGLLGNFPELLFFCETAKKWAKIFPNRLMLQKNGKGACSGIWTKTSETRVARPFLELLQKKCTFGLITNFRKNRSTGRDLNPSKSHEHLLFQNSSSPCCRAVYTFKHWEWWNEELHDLILPHAPENNYKSTWKIWIIVVKYNSKCLTKFIRKGWQSYEKGV